MDKKNKRKFKFPLWIKALLVLVLSTWMVGGFAIGFFSYAIRSMTRNHYIEHSVDLADTLALFLDLDNVKAVKNKVDEIYQSIPEENKVENSYWGEPEWDEYLANYSLVVEMPEYQALLTQIKLFHSKNEVRFTSLGYADLENSRLIYLVDDAEPEDWCSPGSFDAFTESDMTVYDHLDEGFTPEISNMPEYGYLVSVGRPIFDENHDIVAFSLIDLSMDEIVNKEIANTRTLIIVVAALSIGMVVIGYLLVVFLIIRPMRTLTKAANEYTNGENKELNKFEKINIKTADEIEDLSNSMKKMEADIRTYISDLLGANQKVDEMKHLADRDALTGANNKRAYFEVEERLNAKILEGRAKFAIVMIDLNDLKITNDTYGHERGDAAIRALYETINKVFNTPNTYRIGGDEFVVVLEDDEVKRARTLEKTFKQIIEDPNNDVSAAIGVATFDPTSDNNVEDTFKRADTKMYENKKAMKRRNR